MDPRPDFDKAGGLVPVVTQDAETGDVLMLAWMNEEAWEATLSEGIAVYWSRSRQKLWRKGESSGRVQTLRGAFLDCDQDAVLLKVDQEGDAACHTGRRSCFHYEVSPDRTVRIISEPLFDPEDVYGSDAK